MDALGRTGAFYRRPLSPASGSPIPYESQAKLKTFKGVICTEGGLEGNCSNHSEKRTCTTQLYMSGVEGLGLVIDRRQVFGNTNNLVQKWAPVFQRSWIRQSRLQRCCCSNTAVDFPVNFENVSVDPPAACTRTEEVISNKRMRPNEFPFGEFNNCNIVFQF